MKKIVFTGPESSGKTTLAEKLAFHFQLPHVKEVARDYLHLIHRPYGYEDVLNIAMLQLAEEEKIKTLQPSVLICDTDLATIHIWCNDKFNRCEPWLTAAFLDRLPDMYFLCRPDFPWQNDVQREDPHRQEQLFEIHRSLFAHYKIPFTELYGDVETRMKQVLAIMHK